MDPTTRVLLIGQDVTSVLTTHGIPFNNDLTKRFGPDLQMNLGAFSLLLNDIQTKINADTSLNLLTKLNWQAIPPDPTLGTFADYYLKNSINALIIGLDGILSHSPYTS